MPETPHRSAVDSKVHRVGTVPPEFWQNPGGVAVDVASGLDVMPETPHRSAVDSKVHRVGTVPPEFWQNPGGVGGVGVDVASGQSVGTVPPEFWQNPGGVGVDVASV